MAPPTRRAALVVGLGNPGPVYAPTRHNVGFRCAELLAKRIGARWRDAGGSAASLVALGQADGRSLVLAKPQTFMNLSGSAVQQLLAWTGAGLGDLLVVYDDMDLPLGSLRLRERGSAGTHNGMRSLVEQLGSQEFARLRIGIGPATTGDARAYVLGPFSAEELAVAEAAVRRAADAALTWATRGATVAMNRFNTRESPSLAGG